MLSVWISKPTGSQTFLESYLITNPLTTRGHIHTQTKEMRVLHLTTTSLLLAAILFACAAAVAAAYTPFECDWSGDTPFCNGKCRQGEWECGTKKRKHFLNWCLRGQMVLCCSDNLGSVNGQDCVPWNSWEEAMSHFSLPNILTVSEQIINNSIDEWPLHAQFEKEMKDI